MKVLIISHKPPFPIVDGGCLAMSRFLENIHSIEEIGSITYFSISTHKHPFNYQEFPKEKLPKVDFKNSFIDTKLYPLKAFKDLVTGKSYNLSRFYNKKVFNSLSSLCLENNFDLIIFESLYTCVYYDKLKNISKVKFAYRAHNIENHIWRDLALSSRNPFKKWYLSHLQKKLEEFEKNFLNNIEPIFPLSPNDLEIIKSITEKETVLVPVSIEIPKQTISYDRTSLCFIGAFNWVPNIEAINWFSSAIFPSLKKEFPFLELHIAGSHSETISDLSGVDGITLHGFVNSSIDFISKHGIFIAPLKSGSGIKMKVLEAMSIGMPCSLSPKGSEGIIGNFVQNNSENDFISDIKELIYDKSLRIKRGMEGQEIVKSQFSNEAVISIMREQLNLNKHSDNITNIVSTQSE